jgi:putative endonuclease
LKRRAATASTRDVPVGARPRRALALRAGARRLLRGLWLRLDPEGFVRHASPTRAEVGRCGELLAARYLRALGWRLLGSRVHTEHAELDLVAQEGPCRVAVEVKSGRSSPATAHLPREHLTPRTLRRQQRALSSLAGTGPARIDLIEVLFHPRSAAELRHWRGLASKL